MENLFTVLIPIAAVVIIVAVAMRIATHTFKCKRCGKEFKIGWTRVIVTEHSDNEYMLTCPHCTTKGRCTEQAKK